MPQSPPLVLASTSRYRQGLLARLGVPFEVRSPGVDETPIPGESPTHRAVRLAQAKARAVAAELPERIVIGSDQVASLGDGAAAQILRKPGDIATARVQLARLGGQNARFDTAVSVVWPGGERSHCDVTRVFFRPLTAGDIERYIEREPSFDCAGGFKCEGLGVSLMERLESSDPTALVGLPRIWLCDALRHAGLSLP